MSALTRFRAEIDDFMAYHHQSPLEENQQRIFHGLNYYPENKAMIFSVDVERFPAGEKPMEIQTSTGDRQLYQRWGRFTFIVEGQELALTIYVSPHGGGFFLPFKDKSNGQESYGAGRYLDDHRPGLTHLGNNRFRVDFNYAYNPYCAYSDYYSCPLPPAENWLKVTIPAGEKSFK